jgi:hypothetical protein
MTTTIASMLNLANSDRTLVETVGQSVVYTAMQQILSRHRMDLDAAMRVFVARRISDYSIQYRQQGNGFMQKASRLVKPENIAPTGGWTVQFPLDGFADGFVTDDVSYAYMTVSDLDRLLQTVLTRNVNTRRREILNALFRNTARTFVDELRGSLSVQPLANGDSVLYPPILGATDSATENHYAVAGYLVSAISSTNHPVATAVEELVEHFGETPGSENIVYFCDKTQADKLATLSDFVAVEDVNVRTGVNTDIPLALPSVPGKIVGRIKGKAWISQWRFMPSAYGLATHLEVEAPLYERVDLPETGLGAGLQMIATEQSYPLTSAYWRDRFGLGVANRLNGVVLQFKASGSYDIPTF